MAKRQPKPITFFGRELDPTATGDHYMDLPTDSCLSITTWMNNAVDVEMVLPDPFASRKTFRGAVAACERQTLEFAQQLAELTGHKLVKKGQK